MLSASYYCDAESRYQHCGELSFAQSHSGSKHFEGRATKAQMARKTPAEPRRGEGLVRER